jgi:hypothetical protein
LSPSLSHSSPPPPFLSKIRHRYSSSYIEATTTIARGDWLSAMEIRRLEARLSRQQSTAAVAMEDSAELWDTRSSADGGGGHGGLRRATGH